MNRGWWTVVAICCALALVAPALGVTPLEIADWGKDDYSQVSQTPAGAGYTAVAAGQLHSVALRLPAPVAAFETNTTSGVAPLAVQFTDTSTGGGTDQPGRGPSATAGRRPAGTPSSPTGRQGPPP